MNSYMNIKYITDIYRVLNNEKFEILFSMEKIK